jgi:hypothetical protein
MVARNSCWLPLRSLPHFWLGHCLLPHCWLQHFWLLQSDGFFTVGGVMAVGGVITGVEGWGTFFFSTAAIFQSYTPWKEKRNLLQQAMQAAGQQTRQ